MGLAPEPGVGQRAANGVAAQIVVTICVRGVVYKIAPFNLPLKEDLILAKATGGMSVEGLIGDESRVGLRSLKILWWLARRAAGEWQLTLERAWDEWPTDLDLESELEVTIDDASDEVLDPEA